MTKEKQPFVCATTDVYSIIVTKERMFVNVCDAKSAIKKLVRRGRGELKNPAVYAIDRHGNLATWEQWINNTDLHHDNQPYMRSVNNLFAVPTVLLGMDAMFFSIKKNQKVNVRRLYSYFDGICQICETKKPIRDMSIEHIKPRSLGGTNAPENLTLTCKRCNSRKGSIYPYASVTGRPLKGMNIYSQTNKTAPKRPEWEPYLT